MEDKRTWTYLTASQTIHLKKCKLYSIIVTPDGSNASYADIHDGENASEPQVARVRVSGTSSGNESWSEGIILHRGLHIVFETNLSSVTVVSEPL